MIAFGSLETKPMKAWLKSLLSNLKRELGRLYGDRRQGVYLFGSRVPPKTKALRDDSTRPYFLW